MQEKLESGPQSDGDPVEASAEASKMMVAALGPGYQPLTAVGIPALRDVPRRREHLLAPRPLERGRPAPGRHPGHRRRRRCRRLQLRAGAHDDPRRADPRVRKAFDQMQLQQAAFAALRPGRTLAEAEAEVSAASPSWASPTHQRHHTGHGIGLEGHEPPFIDKGDETVMPRAWSSPSSPASTSPALPASATPTPSSSPHVAPSASPSTRAIWRA